MSTTPNLYWPVYKSIEREVLALADVIHIDDKQLNVYSVKIAEVLIRTCVEIESIAKALYEREGGPVPISKNPKFDFVCLKFLEGKWFLGAKLVLISASTIYLSASNLQLLPLNDATKGAKGNSKWMVAYQAVKHSRVNEIEQASIGVLLEAAAALFLLNLYYRNEAFNLGTLYARAAFDSTVGSNLFSVTLHDPGSIDIAGGYTPGENYDSCVYLSKPWDKSARLARAEVGRVEVQILERISRVAVDRLNEKIQEGVYSEADDIFKDISETMQVVRSENYLSYIEEYGSQLGAAYGKLRFEAVLNRQQYKPVNPPALELDVSFGGTADTAEPQV